VDECKPLLLGLLGSAGGDGALAEPLMALGSGGSGGSGNAGNAGSSGVGAPGVSTAAGVVAGQIMGGGGGRAGVRPSRHCSLRHPAHLEPVDLE